MLTISSPVVRAIRVLLLGMVPFSIAGIGPCAPAPLRAAGNWPTYRGDGARTARTDQSLKLPLTTHWVYRSKSSPRRAWPRSLRLTFDRAMQPVIAGNRVVFGSSVTGIVYGLDPTTGKEVWRFFTAGPVRFAPAIWRDRAFVVSDDGCLYALRLADGKLLWRHHGAPDAAFVLGNEAMISKWPARGGPVVAHDHVFFAAGIWPTEGIYLYALDADTGKEVWCNSESGSLDIPQPHPTANAKSGISAQGYLTLADAHLLVPTGRAVPAAFSIATGKLEYFHLQKYGHYGGALAIAVGAHFVNGGVAYDTASGQLAAKLGNGPVAACEDGIIRAAGDALIAYHWTAKQTTDRKGKAITTEALVPRWTAKPIPQALSLLTAGRHVVLGCDGQVAVFDTAAQKVVWHTAVQGATYGLALADDRLFVSTDQGHIYCLGSPGGAAATPPPPAIKAVAAKPDNNQIAATAAGTILQQTHVKSGFCVDLGCGDGALAQHLAQQTDLHIIAIDSDPANVAMARQRLLRANLYGNRVQVLQCDLANTHLPRYFANLVVSQQCLRAGHPIDMTEAQRLTRPYGGALCVGTWNALRCRHRGPLPGAGQWTHQYGDPANTANSQDQLVRGRLTMLWFRDFDFQLAQRHGRPPAPQFAAGRLFHEGLDGIIAVDAYNGHELWRFRAPDILKPYDGDELMGVAGTGTNFCVGNNHLFLRRQDDCVRLDAATGQVTKTYALPRAANDTIPSRWGYIATSGDILFGAQANTEHIVTYRYINRGGDMTQLYTESRALFAIDVDSGKVLWQHAAEHSIRHNAIAIADGKVVFIDRPMAHFDRVKKHLPEKQPLGTLMALDAKTGKVVWRNHDNIYGTMLAISKPHGIVLMSYQPTRFRLDSEVGGRLAALRLRDGTRIWDIEANYASRPMLNGRTIYTQGGAWDLLTGKPVPFEFNRSYGCGILASSRHMLLFRSATLGYYDLTGARTTENYGGIRPGCWINTLPVGGLVLLPDATAGCQCSYLNRSWIALEPTSAR